MVFAAPNADGSLVQLDSRLRNHIDGAWVPPLQAQHLDNVTPITGRPYCEVPRSTPHDVERALDAAHGSEWAGLDPEERASRIRCVADRMEAHERPLAVAESYDRGTPIARLLEADLPRAVQSVRALAGGVPRGRPIAPGVVAQIYTAEASLGSVVESLMGSLADGHSVVALVSAQAPVGPLVWLELVADLLAPGCLNLVTGLGLEAGRALACSERVQRVDIEGGATVCRLVRQWAASRGTAVRVPAPQDGVSDWAGGTLAPGHVRFDREQGPDFLERARAWGQRARVGNPLDPSIEHGPLPTAAHAETVRARVALARAEGATHWSGADACPEVGGPGYFFAPTVLVADPEMRVSREPIPGPVLVGVGGAAW